MLGYGNPQDNDMLTVVNLDILRGEMLYRLDPPPEPSERTEDDIPLGRVAQLEKTLDGQLEEQEKWEELTAKLEKKTKQMADNVVRLDTSLKVFQHELVKRNQNVTFAQEQLQGKKNDQQKVIDQLQQDKQNQLDQADKAKERAQRAKKEREDKQERQEMLTKKLRTSRSGLLPLEERVQDLQINLNGNRGMSESQRIYYNADLQVEKDQRDRVLTTIQTCRREIETLTQEIKTLKGKQSLFEDEQERRIQRAKAVDVQIQEQHDLFQAKLPKFQAEVDAIIEDRNAWEEKTIKLAEDLEDKKVESTKLTVKCRLFNEQLKGVQATVERLKNTIGNMSVTSIASEIEEPEPDPAQYVWRPPQREDPIMSKARKVVAAQQAPVVQKPKTKSAPTPIVKKVVPKYVPPVQKPVVKPTVYQPPVVKVNQVRVQMDDPKAKPVKPYEAMETPAMIANNRDASLTAQLQNVQRDLEHQKRFQKEHAIKMDQQFARLASKVEVLANSADSTIRIQENSTESQLDALKHQIQKDAMRDAHEMRQLLQQLSQQCSQLSTKLECLTATVHQRDQQAVQMEQKLKEKEKQYFDQMEHLRGEMERQLERQQQAFSDKMSKAMIQMEKLVSSGVAATAAPRSVAHDSMTSLESLVPLDSSSRPASSRSSSEEDNSNKMAAAAPPSTRNSGGYSMVASGIKVNNSPRWF